MHLLSIPNLSRQLCITLEVLFQNFLSNVNIDMIGDTGDLKFVKYCRDDFIRFNDEYDAWLLNKEDWKVMPSICYVKGEGIQFMVFKDRDHGKIHAYIHPPI